MRTILLISAIILRAGVADAWIGISFGEDGNNLPSRTAVVQKFKDLGVRHVRTYHTYSDTLRAFANSGIELTVGITNEDFPTQLTTVGSAVAWANANIVPYSSSNIVAVTVGNEVFTSTSDGVIAQLLPSMQNLRQALNQLGKNSITVTTAHAFNVITDSFPPSSGRFADTYTSRMQPIVSWLSSTGSFFIANVYPYFAYVGAGGQISLQYGRLEAGSVTDTGNGKIYTNLLAQQLDSVYAALAKLGFPNLLVRVGEIGWPSAGGTAANVQNAQIHNQNVVNLVRGGTPVKPNVQIDAYIFAMFNENQKPAGIEQNWGLYNPVGFQPVYTINWSNNLDSLLVKNASESGREEI
ncbi:hypothetical protein R1sor_011110 [Riccia sorocarpa]|uniref:Beta-1,3-glucanase n=1 Tax=Riccia sorocarpa TaxID=122646 RepID=A0ABD3I3E9_9MARC